MQFKNEFFYKIICIYILFKIYKNNKFRFASYNFKFLYKISNIKIVPGAGGNKLFAEIHDKIPYNNIECSNLVKLFFKNKNNLQKFIIWINYVIMQNPKCITLFLT